MKNLFSIDSPVFRALSTLADLVWLNLLWLLCCLPVFTAGAATAALYDVLLRVTRDAPVHITGGFFAAFRANFKKATVGWLVLLGAAALVLLDAYAAAVLGGGLLLYALVFLGALVWLFVNAYYFPLVARFENTLGASLRNAFVLSFANFPRTLVVTAVQLSPVLVGLFDLSLLYKLSFLWLMLGGAGPGYINALMLNTVFARYIPEEPGGDDESDD